MKKAFKDYYKILGVPFEATADQIKKAYRALMKQWHPDVNKSADAHEKTVLFIEAFYVLIEKRYDYNQTYQAYNNGSDTSQFNQEEKFTQWEEKAKAYRPENIYRSDNYEFLMDSLVGKGKQP